MFQTINSLLLSHFGNFHDYNQQQQSFIFRDNSMFQTINSLLLSHFGNFHESVHSQSSI